MSLWLALLSALTLAIPIAVVVLVIVLVRRNGPATGPVAAPGQAERNAAAGRLVLELDDAAARAGTALEFARLQLTPSAPGELQAAIAEARASASALSATLAGTHGGPSQGPEGTAIAGRLSAEIRRAESAQARLAAAESRVREETRRLEPPAG